MFHNSSNLYFRSGNIAFLTKHKKEQLVAPIVEPFLGVKVLHVDGFDTDLLGTFTREVKRIDTQLETARKKARIGMDLAKLRMGLGSEGSVTTDPYYGVMPWNIEMLAFIDDVHEIELVGIAEGPAMVLQKSGRSVDEIECLANDFGFPENHMILRPDSSDSPDVIKNVSTVKQLRQAISRCLQMSKNGVVHIENDLRAHACPSRREMIKLAAINLLLKMHSFCPRCNTPGYWVTETHKGLTCIHCHLPTELMKSQVFSCIKCGYAKEVERTDVEHASQESCAFCNP